VRGKAKQAVVAEVHTSFSQAWDAKAQEFDQTKVAALLKGELAGFVLCLLSITNIACTWRDKCLLL
jgi:hypothetical protein